MMGDRDEKNCVPSDDDALLESSGEDGDSSISERMEIDLECELAEHETHSNTSPGLDPRLADSPSPSGVALRMECDSSDSQPHLLKTKHSTAAGNRITSEDHSLGSGDDVEILSSDDDKEEGVVLTEEAGSATVDDAGVNGAECSSGRMGNNAANRKVTSGDDDYGHMQAVDDVGKGGEALSEEEEDGEDDESVPPPIEALESASPVEVPGLKHLTELVRNSRQPPVLTPEKSTPLPILLPKDTPPQVIQTKSSSSAVSVETAGKASGFVNIASKPLDSTSSSLNQPHMVPVTLVGTPKSSSNAGPQQVFALAPTGVLPSLSTSSATAPKTITLTSPAGATQTVYLLPVSMGGGTQGSAPMVVPGVGRVTLAPVSQGQVVNKAQTGVPQQIKAPVTPVARACASKPPIRIAPAPSLSPPPGQPALQKIAPAPLPPNLPAVASTPEPALRRKRRRGSEGAGVIADATHTSSSSSSPTVKGTTRVASPSILGVTKRVLIPTLIPAPGEAKSTAVVSSEASFPQIPQPQISKSATVSCLGGMTSVPIAAPVMTVSASQLAASTAGSIPVVPLSQPLTVSTTIGSVGALGSASQSVPVANTSLAQPVNAAPGVAQVSTSSASSLPLLTVSPSSQSSYLLLMPSGPSSAPAANSSKDTALQNTVSKEIASKEGAGKGDMKTGFQMKSSIDIESISKLIQGRNPVPSLCPTIGKETVGNVVQICPACGDSFLTQTGMDSHLTRMSMLVRHYCDKCQKVYQFHNKCAFLLHVLGHQTETVMAIPNNSIGIKSLPEDYAYLKRHMWQQPSVSSGAQHCWECHTDMRSIEVLQQHFQCQRMVLDATYFCPVCHTYLPSKCAFSAHKRMHLMLPPWVCPDCGLHFPKEFKELLQHMFNACHHFLNLCTFKCMAPYCTKTALKRQDLKQHLLISHGRTYCKCPLCQMAFTQIESLTQHHKEKHPQVTALSPALIFRCFVCNFPTNTKSSFMEHMNEHMKPANVSICRQLRCLYCWSQGNQFHLSVQQRSAMLTHCKNVHSNSSTLSCGLCFQKFASFSSLLMHQMNQHSSTAKETFSCFSCAGCRCFFAYESLKEQHVCEETYAKGPAARKAAMDIALDAPPNASGSSGEAQMPEEPASTSVSVASLAAVPTTSTRAETSSSTTQALLSLPSGAFTLATTSQGASATKTLANNMLMLGPAILTTAKGSGNATLILKGPGGIQGNGKPAELTVVNGTNTLLIRGDPKGLKQKQNVRAEEEEEDVGEMDSSTVLVCRVCFTGIKGKMNLSEHIKEHQDKGTVVCRFCQRMEFASFNDLADHEKTCMLRVREKAKPKEEKPRIFPCHLCGLVYNDKSAHDAHVEEVHKASRKQFTCTLCNRKSLAKTFHRAEHLERHLVTHRIPKTQVRELMEAARKASQVATSSKPAAETLTEATSGDAGSLTKLRVKESGMFTCAKCGFQAEEKEVFGDHIKQHYKPEDGTLCPECGLCYAALPSLKKHLALVHKVQDATRYVMGLGLDQVLAASDPLPPKEVVPDPSSGGGPHECRVCYRQFSTDTQLHTHMRTHGMAFIRSRRFTSRNAKSSSSSVGGGGDTGGSGCDGGSDGGAGSGSVSVGRSVGGGAVTGSGHEQGFTALLSSLSAAAGSDALDATAKAIKKEALESEDGEMNTPPKKKARTGEHLVRIKQEPLEAMEEN